MDNSLAWLTQLFESDHACLRRFRRALRRPDQRALDELLNATQKPVKAAAKENFTIPMELFIIAVILEEQKEIIRLKALIKELEKHLDRAE